MRFADNPDVRHTKARIQHDEAQLAELEAHPNPDAKTLRKIADLHTDIWIGNFYLKVARILYTEGRPPKENRRMTGYLTKTARFKLARTAAKKAFGNASPHHVGRAGKAIDSLVEADPNQFIDFSNPRYCTPKHQAIVEAAASALTQAENDASPQLSLGI